MSTNLVPDPSALEDSRLGFLQPGENGAVEED